MWRYRKLLKSAILDFECTSYRDYGYLIKEMSVIDTRNDAVQHWLFKHTNLPAETVTSHRVNGWVKRYGHQLLISSGDVEYREVERILKSLRYDIIYVMGSYKQNIISKIIPYVNVINLDDFGCPTMNQLCVIGDAFPRCIQHGDVNPKQCTLYIVFTIKNWLKTIKPAALYLVK